MAYIGYIPKRGRPVLPVFGPIVGLPVNFLPAVQTVDFGRSTRVGHGGHKLGYVGTGYLGITAGNSLGHWTINDLNQLVPANGAGAFGTAPASMNASYTLTVTEYSDAGKTSPTGQTQTTTVNTTANRYTVTNKDTGANADTSTVFQLRSVLTLITALGAEVYLRDGMVFNPTAGDWRVRRTGAAPTGFTGSNHTLIRPETDFGATIRSIGFDGQYLDRIKYLRLYRVNFELTSAQVAGVTNTTAMIYDAQSGLTDSIIEECRFRSTSGSFYGDDQASAIKLGLYSARITVKNCDVWDVGNGIYIGQGAGVVLDGSGTSAYGTTTSATAADSSRAHTVIGNVLGRVAGDVINIQNPSGDLVQDNIIYDKATQVKPWSKLTAGQQATQNSPYDTSVQAHGDAISLDYTSSMFGSAVGPTIINNFVLRGQGRDTMPFYTNPPYPNPDSKGYVPGTDASFNDCQGVFFSNNDASRPVGYVTEVVGPIVRNNVYDALMSRGISLIYARDPIVEFNTCLGDKGPAAAGLRTGNLGSNGGISCTLYRGTAGRVTRNISATMTLSADTGGSLTSTANNVTASYSASTGPTAHANLFNAPIYGPSLITNILRASATSPADAAGIKAAAISAFKAQAGSAADLGSGVYIGAYKNDGTLTT